MTTTNDKPIYVEVPARYIKDKAIDFDGEVFSTLGGGWYLFGKLVKAPSLGVFSLLESFESKFISNAIECTKFDVMRVLYVNQMREACVQEVMDFAYPNGKWRRFRADDTTTWSVLDHNVRDYCMEELSDMDDESFCEDFKTLLELFALQFEGLAMIPSGGSGKGAFWFGSDTIAAMATSLSIPVDEVLWNMPLCTLGHMMAATAKANGTKGVARPKDDEDRKHQFELARERVRNGELHPWQIADPENWPLTSIQKEHCPSIAERWKKIVEEKNNA